MGKRSRGKAVAVSCDKCGMRVSRGKAHIVYRRTGKNYYCVRCSKRAKLTGKGRIIDRSGPRRNK